MKSIKNKFKILFLVMSVFLLISSCSNITDINENPNGVDPNSVDPNLVMSTVMTTIAKDLTNKGFAGDIGASVQYIQRDSWSNNNYEWKGSGWTTYFNALRDNKLAYDRAVELGWEYHQGVTLVMKSMIFGLLTDFYGDVPYTEALKGDEGSENIFPKYDPQKMVYEGIIKDLKTAAGLLSKSAASYDGINETQDVYFHGDPSKWQKFANSLALKYYMRLSEKEPQVAEAGVKEMLKQPLMTSIDDDCTLDYIGASGADSWPTNGLSGTPSNFWRVKPCTTLTDKLQDFNDPRIDLWFNQVEIPIQVVDEVPGGGDDVVVDGVRYLKASTLTSRNMKIYNPSTWEQDVKDGWILVDTHTDYVGLPVAVQKTDPFEYNLNPSPERGGTNVHVSTLNNDFNEKSGDKLKARIMSSAEVHFLMAEAAIRGWGSNAEAHYYAGIQDSFDAWGIGNEFSDYADNSGVVFDGTLKQIMVQKWIANFGNGVESYFDWRRTGFPELSAGPYGIEDVIPVRFTYDDSDRFLNSENYNEALNNLEETSYSHLDGVDSTWSKMWLLQGTSKPW